MQWKAISFLAIFVCVACSELTKEDSEADSAPVARQYSVYNAYAYDPYAIPAPLPQPSNRSLPRFGLYLLLLQLIRGLPFTVASNTNTAETTTQAPAPSSSFDSTGWHRASNQCYYRYFPDAKMWLASKNDCEERGANLAHKGFKGTDSIATTRHEEILRALNIFTASAGPSAWIGIENLGTSGYLFIDGHSASSGNAAWEATPVASVANCGAVIPEKFGFQSYACTETRGRLCEHCPFS